MQESLQLLQTEAASLFAATIIFVVFFLVARIGNVRQLPALAFAMMPLLLAWAAVGIVGAGV